VEDATVQEAVDHLSDIGPEETIFLFKTLVIDRFQRFKIVLDAPVIWCFLRLAGAIDRRCTGH